jgi:hypothetical protein
MGGAGKKRGKEGVRRALELAQHSTASMGRFDELRPGEPTRKIKGKKRSFRDNLDRSGNDKVRITYCLSLSNVPIFCGRPVTFEYLLPAMP